MRRILCVATVVVALAAASGARSLDLNLGVKASLGLDATFGLDDRTRAFIQSLPAEVREQVIKMLKEALPLVDESVLKYLARVDDIMGNQLNNLQCTLVGTGKILGADLKSTFSISGKGPTPVEDLSKDRDNVLGGYSKRTTPSQYQRKYADFLYRAATTSCQVSVAPEAKTQVTALQEDIRPRWRIWSKLDGLCSEVRQCIVTAQTSTGALIAKSDKRDLDSVNAMSRFKGILVPEVPGWFDSWNPSPSEKILIEMTSISEGVEVARRSREAVGAGLVASAKIKLTGIGTQLAGARASLNRNQAAQNASAIAAANAAVPLIAKVREELAAAVAVATTTKQDVEDLTKVANIHTSAIPSIIGAANQNISAIDAREALRMLHSLQHNMIRF